MKEERETVIEKLYGKLDEIVAENKRLTARNKEWNKKKTQWRKKFRWKKLIVLRFWK